MDADRLRQEIDALDTAEWTAWPHAYGQARDTPAHLAALLGDDSQAQHEAASHFSSAIVHQSSVWPASPDAFAWLIRVLRVSPLPHDVLYECLGALVEAAEYLGEVEADTPVPELSRAARDWLDRFDTTPDDDHELLWGEDEEVEDEVYRWMAVRMAALRPSVTELAALLAARAPQACADVREAWQPA